MLLPKVYNFFMILPDYLLIEQACFLLAQMEEFIGRLSSANATWSSEQIY